MRHVRSQRFNGVRSQRRAGTVFSVPQFQFNGGVAIRRFDHPVEVKRAEPIPLQQSKPNFTVNSTKNTKAILGGEISDPKEAKDIRKPLACKRKILASLGDVLAGKKVNTGMRSVIGFL